MNLIHKSLNMLSVKATVFILLTSITSALSANETGYEVELIIFEDVKSRYIQSEDWTYNDMLHNTKTIVSKKDSKTDPEYAELNWDDSKLANNLQRLKNNSNYKVLLNKRWKQTGLDREKSFNIPVNKKELEASTEDDEKASPNNLPESSVIVESYISGDVKLIMSRYLHFNVNLQYTKPVLNEFGETVSITYPVVAERRMKSKEIHYLDHPLIGIVVLATPYKIQSDDPETKTTDYRTL